VNTVKHFAVEPAKMHLKRGYNYKNLQQYEQALDEYRKALTYFPDYASVYINMANTYEYQGKQNESFAAMEKAIQIAPWNPSACYGRGRHYKMQGKHDEALPLYLEALKYQPQKPLYIFGLARLYQDKGDTTNAVKYFQQYLEYAPHGEHAEFVKQYLVSVNVPVEEDPADIVTLLKKKEYQALELQLATLLREKKKDTDGRSLLSQAYQELYGNPDAKYAFETWLSYFEDWLEYNPSSHFANASIGMFYIRYAWNARGTGWANTVTEEGSRLYQERLLRAHEHLENAYMLDPSDPVVPAYLIKTARGLRLEYEEMEKQFQRAIQADISEYRAYYEKLVYLMPKWYGSERQMFFFAREVVKNAPPDSLVPLVLANAHWEMYFRSKNQSAYFKQSEVWEELKPVYNLLCQRFPNSKERHNWFAVTAYLAGDYETARKELTIIQDDWLEQAWGDFEYFTKVKNEVFKK
jgi:tetratricopeptide (TPR) repeat protein